MATRHREYFWYLEPLDSHTNEVIGKYLWEDENAETSRLCADGIRRNLWRCQWCDVERFQNSRQDLKLKFKVFVQEGQGQIRAWFLTKTRC